MKAMGLFLSFYQRLFKTREMPIILYRGGGGSTSIYKPYSAVSPQRVRFLRQFWTGFGYGSRRNYGSVRTYLLFQFQMKTEKDRVIYEFEVDFKKSFIWRSHLSNDDIIS